VARPTSCDEGVADASLVTHRRDDRVQRHAARQQDGPSGVPASRRYDAEALGRDLVVLADHLSPDAQFIRTIPP
jgi:hypothetical protein